MLYNNIFSQIIFAYLISDLISGLGHFIEDNILNDDNTKWIPFLKQIHISNKMHHKNARLMLEYNYFETISTTLSIFGFFYFLFIIIFGLNFLIEYIYFHLTFTLLIVNVNQIHKWQHMNKKERPFLVTILMNFGIILSDIGHKKHHLDFNTNFCIISPYFNILHTYIKKLLIK